MFFSRFSFLCFVIWFGVSLVYYRKVYGAIVHLSRKKGRFFHDTFCYYCYFFSQDHSGMTEEEEGEGSSGQIWRLVRRGP
jgi:hypothetical protein